MSTISDRSGNLILGSCVALVATVLSVSAYAHLRTVRDETRIRRPLAQRSSPDVISQRTEDAIKVETLGALFDSPNYDIRQA